MVDVERIAEATTKKTDVETAHAEATTEKTDVERTAAEVNRLLVKPLIGKTSVTAPPLTDVTAAAGT